VGPVPSFHEPDLPGRGVGDEGLVPPPVAMLDRGQLRAGVGMSRRTMTRIPVGHAVRIVAGSTAVISTTSACSRTSPSAARVTVHAVFGTSVMA
jgi:hypothetical protein